MFEFAVAGYAKGKKGEKWQMSLEGEQRKAGVVCFVSRGLGGTWKERRLFALSPVTWDGQQKGRVKGHLVNQMQPL